MADCFSRSSPITDLTVEAYTLAFDEIADADLVRATGLALKSLKFFPRPVELIELATGVDQFDRISSKLRIERLRRQRDERAYHAAPRRIGNGEGTA